MAPILHLLPAELVSRIFSFISQRRDIASCRLVNKAFHELSSPFLITTVVLALRLDTLTRLKEVADHPYFSRHVTDLIYDASRDSTELATNWIEYIDRCHSATSALLDPEWEAKQREDAGSLSSLDNLEQTVSFEPWRQSAPSPADFIEDYFEELYTLGCHKSFPSYYRRSRAQQIIQAKDLHWRALKRCLEKCPKLRNVIFTEYRALIHEGESYDERCMWLFGGTLEPGNLQTVALDVWRDAFLILDVVWQTPGARLESFKIAPYANGVSSNALHGRPSEGPASGIPLQTPSFLSLPGLDKVKTGFSTLRTFEMTFDGSFSDWNMSRFHQLLEAAAPNLVNLSLNRAVVHYDKYEDNDLSVFPTTTHDIFSIHCPRLRYLDLCRLHLKSLKPLQDFLSGHSSTLREVRLIEVLVASSEGEYQQLDRWAAENLHLTGAEIVHSEDMAALQSMNRMSDRPYQNRFIEVDPFVTAAAPKAERAVQNRSGVWIRGRENSLKRTVELVAPDTVKSWLRPSSL